MTDTTVLLVDDAPDIRFLLRMIINAQTGITVISEGANGQEAVDLCAELAPDVILLDISMPIMDGLEAIPLIREVSPSTEIVMLSGFTTDEIKARATKLGACAFVEKGTGGPEIVSAIRACAGCR